MADRIQHDADISARYLREKFAAVSAYRWQGGTLMDKAYEAEARLARLFARHWKEATDA